MDARKVVVQVVQVTRPSWTSVGGGRGETLPGTGSFWAVSYSRWAQQLLWAPSGLRDLEVGVCPFCDQAVPQQSLRSVPAE